MMNIKRPTPDPRGQSVSDEIRNAAADLEEKIRLLPRSRRRARAIIELEGSLMWAEAAYRGGV